MTTFTLAAPTTGPTSSVFNQVSGAFKVTPSDNTYTGTITPNDGGAGGTFYPASHTVSASSVAFTFYYRPPTGGSSASITITGSPAIAAVAPITYNWTTNYTALNDNFTRANTALGAAGSTNVGNGWTDIVGNIWQISSNQLVGTTVAHGSSNGTLEQPAALQDCRVTALSASNWASTTQLLTVNARIQSSEPAGTAITYAVQAFQNNTNTISIIAVAANGSNTTVALSANGFASIVSGHAVQLDAVFTGVNPTTISATLIDTVTGIVIAQVTGTDSTASLQQPGATGLGPTILTGPAGTAVAYAGASVFTPVANAISLAGPSNVPTGYPSTNYTVTPNGPFTGSVTLSSTVPGSFSPSATLNWSNSSTPQTVTFTASANGSGTISATNTGSLANPSPIAITAATPASFTPNNASVYATPMNWNSGSGGSLWSNWPGAYLKFGFGGTSLLLQTNNPLAGEKIFYNIDGGADQYILVPAGSQTLQIAAGLAAGTHQIQIGIAALGTTDRWGTSSTLPQDQLNITGILLDAGSTLSAPTNLLPQVGLHFGDSITEGCSQLSPGGSDVAHSQWTTSWDRLLAIALNAEISVVACQHSGYELAGEGNVPNVLTYWNELYAGAARTFTPVSYIWINHGTNGNTTQADVQTLLTELRAAFPTTPIFQQVPFGQYAASAITAAVAAQNDPKVILVNLGANGNTILLANSYDGIHPNVAGCALLEAQLIPVVAADALPFIKQQIANPWYHA
jgi:hypothetical protein